MRSGVACGWAWRVRCGRGRPAIGCVSRGLARVADGCGSPTRASRHRASLVSSRVRARLARLGTAHGRSQLTFGFGCGLRAGAPYVRARLTLMRARLTLMRAGAAHPHAGASHHRPCLATAVARGLPPPSPAARHRPRLAIAHSSQATSVRLGDVGPWLDRCRANVDVKSELRQLGRWWPALRAATSWT